ncbi:DUF6035 family protein [Luteimonas sp. MC1750]|uniref:DUF6035 family protein n=1 Tax=Luteimonas sp. MC1750 TaxID=2799326 RepID=UPI0018F07A58|nr:DUF6035 family protein [Luteimonas sp. MC1750]MBJ6984047.1 hypothetical protein [Luteimonas sp. MC1750]QQO06859.1 hypothetical protein JGR68_05375 [Luteimonas sp. MC1750]
MDQTTSPAHRKTTLAHNPHYGVLDLATGANLTLGEFIGVGDYGELIEHRRLALEHDLIEGRVRYVCQKCRKPMVLRSLPADKHTENRFFLKHRYRSDECGGTKGLTHEAICALRYANTKESPEHIRYKQLLIESLACDRRFSDKKTEERWFDQDGVRWRQPDVQAMYGTQRVALEVQLSTTFVEVVAQRQAFYRRNVGRLLWFFRDLDIAAFRQAEDDVFHTNNRNAFLVDEESLASSKREGRFMLWCTWEEPRLRNGQVHNAQMIQLVGFDQLSFDTSSIGAPRAYFFDYEAARALLGPSVESEPTAEPVVIPDFEGDEALRALMDEMIRGYPNHVDNNALWSVVRAKFGKRGFALPEHFRLDPIFPLLQAAYSAVHGRPVGGSQTHLIELANTLYNSHKPALFVFSVMMGKYNRGAQLLARGDRAAWLEKVRTYHQAWADGAVEYAPATQYAPLLEFLFPSAREALAETPQSYVARVRAARVADTASG